MGLKQFANGVPKSSQVDFKQTASVPKSFVLMQKQQKRRNISAAMVV